MTTKRDRYRWLLSQERWHAKRALDTYEIKTIWMWHDSQAIWYERQMMRLHER